MNEDLIAVRKFRGKASIIGLLFYISTLTLIPICSYYVDNYWLLFGILFSFLGSIDDVPNSRKLILPFTIGATLYWVIKGFYFFDNVTFFWFSFLFGKLFQSLVDTYKNLANQIIDEKVSAFSSAIRDGVAAKKKSNL